ncbi:MAG TPA: hypothetical protein VIK08_06955 [Candidatus Limnocylindrales bacterium]
MSATDWLLAADPAIRWQTLRDLIQAAPDEIATERARVENEGWGAALIQRLTPGGDTRAVVGEHRDWVVLETLLLLRAIGLDPGSEAARTVIARVRDEVTWNGVLPQDAEWHGKPFFHGEVEPCINGRVLAVGAYFGQDVQRIADRLLTEQMDDGGWNCEDDNGATVGSFATTINVLEGLLEFENAHGGSAEVAAARQRGETYLVERGMFRRRSTGEIADEAFLDFSFPPGYHYDVLRGLDYLRVTGAPADSRVNEAVELVERKRNGNFLWLQDVAHPNHLDFVMDDGPGQPSVWNTLRALRVLSWARGSKSS